MSRTQASRAFVLGATLALASVPATFGQVPGPEIFDKVPTTPLELWDAADYLVRTGQPGQAVPYLNQFLKSRPDDDTLLALRDRYGVGSILRLDNFPETRPIALAIVNRLADAARRNATRPERIERFVATLSKTAEEQHSAVERLREAGPYAVPALIRALDAPALAIEDRVKVVRNLGRLDRSAVPPLIATLDAPNVRLAADAADALGRIGDLRAVPELTFLAAHGDRISPARAAARQAIERLTGRPFEAQRRSPVHVLTDEARRFHLHKVGFPGDSVIVWEWDEAAKVPASRQVSKSEAEAIFGLKLAREALQLDPTDVPAQVVLLSLALEKAVERVGFTAFPANDPANTIATALAAGPEVLGRVVRTALSDGKYDLAAAVLPALGQVTDREVLATGNRRANPLVEALTAPSRRAQFAAARAIVALDPRKPFPGSSQVVPILARFVSSQSAPRAIVIDGNAARGGQQVGFLKAIGYDARLALTGDDGFRAAAESSDVELILLDCHLVQGDWRVLDTVSNLKADARTASIPVYIVGPLNVGLVLDDLAKRYPVKFLVTPTNPRILEEQLGGRPSGLTDAERTVYAREAALLLGSIASRPGNPFEPDLVRAEPALAIALNLPAADLASATALGDVPDAGAQRGLADALLDSAKPAPLRLNAANQLTRSIQRFGPLVTAEQETHLLGAFDQAADPGLRTGLASVLGALGPKAGLNGVRLRTDPATAPPSPAPGATPPPPPTPDAPPPAAEAPAPAETGTEAKP